MNELLEYLVDVDKDRFVHMTLDSMVKALKTPIPLFEPFDALEGKSLYVYILQKEGRVFILERLLKAGGIDLEERNRDRHNIVQLMILNGHVEGVRLLLQHGARLNPFDCRFAKMQKMKNLLIYRPGASQPSVIQFCSAKTRPADYTEKVHALLLDELDTTDCSSSDAIVNSEDELSGGDQERLNSFRSGAITEFNRLRTDRLDSLRLVAFRGVHFSLRHISHDDIKSIRDRRKQAQTTFSPSTLFDAGYFADSEVDETDEEIRKRHETNTHFIASLKSKPDQKEVRSGQHKPPRSRNTQVFEFFLYRFIQIYVNSYNVLFDQNKALITNFFKFDSLNNPLISTTWDVKKAYLYAAGHRLGWLRRDEDLPVERKNPHYRRFTGKAKHPNIGYIDAYAFDIDYVKANGIDVQLLQSLGKVSLSYRHSFDEEIIFVSMIPKTYHVRRYMVSFPSFDQRYVGNEGYYRRHGINTISDYNKFKEAVQMNSADSSRTKRICDLVDKMVEKASDAQGQSINKTMSYRLFKAEKPRAIAYDHGTRMASERFHLKRS